MRSRLWRTKTAGLVVAALLCLNGSALHAESYPSRTVKAVTDVGTGGTYDIFARALAEELNRRWDQPVVVEPHPGGNAVIGNRTCADAVPDGYTICLLSNQGLVANTFLYKKLPYSAASFSPIMNLFYNTQVIVVSASLNVRTLDDLAALAKAKPGTLNYIVPGTFQRVFFDRFNKRYGTDLVAVPFKGGGDALTGVLSGVTPIAFIGGANFAPYVHEGKMVALAVDSVARSPLFPEIPTLAEARPGADYPSTWFGLFAPAGTPKPILAKLADEVTRIVNEPGFRQRMFVDRAVEPSALTLDAFAHFVRDERKVAERIVKESGLRPE